MQSEEKRNSKVHVIRVPLEISNEIVNQAEVTDRSFNRIVVRILEAHLEQEKKVQVQK